MKLIIITNLMIWSCRDVIHGWPFNIKIFKWSETSILISDETRQISQLICLALNELDFVDDYDRRLKFLTDCRAKFNRLEVVQIHLVYSVLNMAMEALKNVSQRNESKRRPRIHGFLQVRSNPSMTLPKIVTVFVKNDFWYALFISFSPRSSFYPINSTLFAIVTRC